MNSQDLIYFYEKPPMMTRKQFMRSQAKPLIYVPDDGPRYMKAMIPIRLFIFVLTFMFLIIIIYHASFVQPELNATILVFLIAASFAYLIFDAIHIIGHFSSSDTVEYPMIFGSFIAFYLFSFMGTVICAVALITSWTILYALLACFGIAFLHAIDVLLAIGYWHYKYSNHQKCGLPHDETTIHVTRNGGDYLLRKCHVHTSTSGVITKEGYGEYGKSNTIRVANQPYNMECPKNNLKTDEYPMIAATSMQTEANSV
ncbi:hypothetical protein PV326_005804 [Microctonus aethiopoides]|nr:hypothetical protein PV326_005804 [Microctonus aethiopoides]